jgi:hypothetical protein
MIRLSCCWTRTAGSSTFESRFVFPAPSIWIFEAYNFQNLQQEAAHDFRRRAS